jgi:hypothetical protein
MIKKLTQFGVGEWYLHFDSNGNGNNMYLMSQTAETDVGQRSGQVSNRSVMKAVGEFGLM